MFLFEPNQTPYDLRWQMFGIPVRVNPMFWLAGALLGWQALHFGFEYLLFWMGVFFISILIHELGHIWMGQVFGSHGHIVLYGFGGLAIGSNQLSRPWQRIAVCFAGPCAGFLLLGVTFLVLAVKDPVGFDAFLLLAKADLGITNLSEVPHDPEVARRLVEAVGVLGPPPLLDFVLSQMIFINLLWGLINLLPVWPLDGGQISRDLCKLASPHNGLRISLGISLLTAGLFAVHCLLAANGKPLFPFLPIGSTYSAIFFGLFAVESLMLLQQLGPRNRDPGDWERDPEIWGR